MNEYGRHATLGIQFAASMCLLGYAGHWADGKLGTHPWLLIVGLFLGAAGGFYSLLKSIPPVRKRSASDRRDDSAS